MKANKMYPISYYNRTPQDKNQWVRNIIKLWRSVYTFGRDFCMESSIHGFNHIAAPNRHWFERLIWVFIILAAIAGTLHISLDQWQRYTENPTVMTLEKDFRSWRFSYPAVTACDVNRTDPDRLVSVVKSYWNVSPGDEEYSYYSNFVQTVANSNLYNLSGFKQFQGDRTLDVDLFQLAVDVMPPLQLKATWSEAEGVTPNWVPIMTEAGVCYVINSLADIDDAIVKPHPNDTEQLPRTCKSIMCNLMLEFSKTTDLFVHSPYDTADVTDTPSRGFQTLSRVTELSVTETKTGKGVRDLKPKRRRCRYTDEPTEKDRHVYSTHICRRSCRNQLAINLCGCKPFYNFYEEGPPCNAKGMNCLSGHAGSLERVEGTPCVCAPQCVDSVFRELSTVDQIWGKGPFMFRGSIKVLVQSPRTRYTREIVFHFQDLVVSFGGAAGLFLGASFISFVEIFYFMLERVLKVFGADYQSSKIIQVKEKGPEPSHETLQILKLNKIIHEQNINTMYWKTTPSTFYNNKKI